MTAQPDDQTQISREKKNAEARNEANDIENVLGRYGHHPDPAIDFCIEVEIIEGLIYDAAVGLAKRDDVRARLEKAMSFRVGGDLHAIEAKQLLRTKAAALSQAQSGERRGDALLDSTYIAGAKAGYNLGVTEDHEGLKQIIDARAGYLRALSATAPPLAGTREQSMLVLSALPLANVANGYDDELDDDSRLVGPFPLKYFRALRSALRDAVIEAAP